MLAHKKCLKCLNDLSVLALELSISGKPGLKTQKSRLKKKILALLEKKFSTKKVPASIFSCINRRIKNLTGVHDAFSSRKRVEMEISRRVALKIRKNYKNNLTDLLLYSATGNSLDFFKELNHTARQMQKNIFFSKDSTDQFKKMLKKAETVLFFADNSGELYFDLPLVKYLTQKVKIYYCVKSKPVQNDLTMLEIKKSGLADKFPYIVASGNDAVGIDLKSISENLRKKLKKCDLIIAKGMGYYETFTELPQYRDKTFHLLMAKCPPVAKSLNVTLNSYVFCKSEI